MRQWTFLLLITSAQVWSKTNILISYFDAFNSAPFNNSQVIAQSLAERLQMRSEFQVSLCPLQTIYDRAFEQLETCLKALPTSPNLVLSLGEGGCELKLETRLKNLDQSFAPDNAGQERFQTMVINSGPEFLSLKYPIEEMYCSLNRAERMKLEISRSAGAFVCNNTAFKMRFYYPEINYGFIHVPAHHCMLRQRKTQNTIERLEKMLLAGLKLMNQDIQETEIHSDVIKSQIKNNTGCAKEFYERLHKSQDEGFLFNFTN